PGEPRNLAVRRHLLGREYSRSLGIIVCSRLVLPVVRPTPNLSVSRRDQDERVPAPPVRAWWLETSRVHGTHRGLRPAGARRPLDQLVQRGPIGRLSARPGAVAVGHVHAGLPLRGVTPLWLGLASGRPRGGVRPEDGTTRLDACQ